MTPAQLGFLAVAAIAVAPVASAGEGEAVVVDEAPANTGILPIPDYGGDLGSRSHLLGDLGGARTRLARKGLQWDIQFTQTLQSVLDGGRDTGTEYGGTLDYNLTLDFDRMGIIPGGLLSFRAESRYGNTVNGIAGPLLPANLDGNVPLTDRLDEDIAFTITNLNYTQFFSEKFGVAFGKFDTLVGDNNEFASGRGVSQFMNFNMALNAAGGFPLGYSALGGGFFWMPKERWTINSFLLTTQDSSTTTGFDNLGDGWTWSTEVYHQHELGGLPGGLMGAFTYSFDGDFTNLNGKYVPGSGGGLAPTTENETWAFNFNGWQYLYTEDPGAGPVDVTNGIADHQGVGVFARLAFADTDTNPVKFFASGGLGGRGIIPDRDDDTFGLGYFYTSLDESRLTGLLGARDHSQGFEAYYNIALSPAASLTADVQVLDSPFISLDTAVLAGLRLNLRF